MKTFFSQLPAMLLFLVPVVGFVACANRGMEAPDEPLLDSSGGAPAGAGGSVSGAAGAATGGSIGTGGAVGGRIGTSGTGGGAAPGAGGTGGTSTGGVAGGSSGGAVGTGGAAGRGSGGAAGTGSGGAAGHTGAAGAGGRSTGGVAGGTAGQGGAGGLTPLIVSIDFIGGRSSTPPPAMAASETAGAKPAANWNSAANNAGTLPNLRAADGSETTATVTWNCPAVSGQPGQWDNGFTDAPGDVRMMNGYLDPSSSGSPATVTVSALPAAIAGGYDVYVYGYGDIGDSSTRKYQYAIGTTTFTVSQTGPSTPFSGLAPSTSGGSGDYVVFRKVTGASFTLTATPGTGNPTRAPVNGIQIVWPSGS